MSRQQALNQIWKRLFLVLFMSMGACSVVFLFQDVGRVGMLVFLIGNIGGYVSVHRGLGDLNDAEIVELAASWWAIIVPSFVGGVLALHRDEPKQQGLASMTAQHAVGFADYAKLFFWSFMAGLNQKYVVNIIESVKAKP